MYDDEYKKEISKKSTLKDLNYDEMKRKRRHRIIGAVFLLFFAVIFIFITYNRLFNLYFDFKFSEIFTMGYCLFPTLLPALRLFNLIAKKEMILTTCIGTLVCFGIYIILIFK